VRELSTAGCVGLPWLSERPCYTVPEPRKNAIEAYRIRCLQDSNVLVNASTVATAHLSCRSAMCCIGLTSSSSVQ
jgi:hypothetical protein